MEDQDQRLSRADLRVAMYGAWDGDLSVIAILVALARQSSKAIVIAGVGAAIGAMLSMGSGEWIESESIKSGLIMAGATVSGTLIPVIPFLLFGKTAAFVVGLTVSFALALLIAHLRQKGTKGYLSTIPVFLITVGITVLVAVLAPGSAA